MRGLTSEFGMGSGISLSLLPPSKNLANESIHNSFNQVLFACPDEGGASKLSVTSINRRLKLFLTIGIQTLTTCDFLYFATTRFQDFHPADLRLGLHFRLLPLKKGGQANRLISIG